MHPGDHAIRQAAFQRLIELERTYRDAIPSFELAKGFQVQGTKIPFKSQQGIFRPAALEAKAALSITTVPSSPYNDQEREDEWLYSYRLGDINGNDNRNLRGAMEHQVPVIFFQWVSQNPATYEAVWPCWIVQDFPEKRCVRVQAGRHFVPDLLGGEVTPENEIERRYATRQSKVRLHQRRFRRKVLRAYDEHCLICRLREPDLLDASHIVGDADAKGVAAVSNGMALCAIHHRAFDGMLLTIDPDYKVRVSERLLDDEDGPMLEHGIKDFHGKDAMYLPKRIADRPDRDALEERLARFE